MQKLYCYVDESGQDTQGRLFLVSVVILDKEKEELKKILENTERSSKKGIRKWSHSNKQRRREYIIKVFESNLFKNKIFYSDYRNSKAYVDLTILTAAKSILRKAKDNYQATILVDGLKRPERYRFAAGLRRLRVKVKKVRGIKDQADVFIRLSDAIAGFIRNGLEGDKETQKLYKEFLKKKFIEKV